MKLVTFGLAARLGAWTGKGIVDINAAVAHLLHQQGDPQPQRIADAVAPPDILEFLRGGERAMRWAKDALSLDLPVIENPRLLSPLPHPTSVRDFYAFEAHVKKGFEKRGEPMPQEWYEIPVYYRSGNHNIIGTGQDVLWPSFTGKFDYELELAAVIGKTGTNIKASEARQYIAGFMVMNDFSARDIQRREMKVRLGPAKGKDWCTAFGPALVTTDEIGDPYNLRMTARINGELWSDGNSGSIYWTFEQMIEFLTQDDTIYPGDILGSGTVGTGCGLELDRWVQPGDVMELEIEKIGVLRNRVLKRGAGSFPDRAR